MINAVEWETGRRNSLAQSVRCFVLNASYRLVQSQPEEGLSMKTKILILGIIARAAAVCPVGWTDRNLDRKMLFILKYGSL